ncbi:response regulator [Ideonella sp. B508-1]|uniref:response regulator n=1 Tax=Ideonella sp. B508-1 TaxID=137716 RepID=UPI00034D49C5|nr:response regulator [Ideonella sp. B508-1]
MTDARAGVLLVEDDAAIRQFVTLALEDLPVVVRACATVDEALAALQEAPARLVLTDLHLAGESGLRLLEHLAGDATLRGHARLAVFSGEAGAHIPPAWRALGVWRVVPKPASVKALIDCVQAALAAGPGDPGDTPDPVGVPPDGMAEEPQGAAAAIATHFDGDQALYEAFRTGAQAQFPVDRAAGAQACARGDAVALRHLGHSLRTVLGLLGEPQAAQLAWQLQKTAEAPGVDAHRLGELWRALDAVLARLSR